MSKITPTATGVRWACRLLRPFVCAFLILTGLTSHAHADVQLAFAVETESGAQSKPYIRAEAACLQGFRELETAFPNHYMPIFRNDPVQPRCLLRHEKDPDSASPRAELRIRQLSCPDSQWLDLADGACVAPQYFVTTQTPLADPLSPTGLCPRCDRVWADSEETADATNPPSIPPVPAVVTDSGINLATGERVVQEVDFRSHNAQPLLFVRQYNSGNTKDLGLGRGWRHQFMRSVAPEPVPAATPYDADAPTYSLLRPSQQEACELGWRDVRSQAQPSSVRRAEARYEQGVCLLWLGTQALGRLAVHSSLGAPLAVAFQNDQSIEGAVFDSRRKWTEPSPSVAVNALRPDGGTLRFVRDTRHGWRGPLAMGYRLRDTAKGLVLTTPAGTNEHYLADGQLQTIISRAGLQMRLKYDSDNRLVGVTNHFGSEINFEYDKENRLAAATDGAGLRYTFEYDERNLLTTVVYPDLVRRGYGYRDDGSLPLMHSINDESNQIAQRWTYDDRDRVTHSEHALETQRRSYRYDDDDWSVTVQEATGASFVARFIRIAGRPLIGEIDYSTCTTCPNGKKSIQYNADGFATLIRDVNGALSQVEYIPGTDLPRRHAQQAGDQQRITQWRWDTETRLLQCETNEMLTTEYSHDERGLLLRQMQFDTSDPALFKGSIHSRTCTAIRQRLDLDAIPKRSWHYVYSSDGLLIAENGPRLDVEDVTRYHFDNAGNLSRVINASGHVIEFLRHNGHGLPGRRIDENGTATDFGYDARGRVLYETRSGEKFTQVTTYEYLPSGSLARKTLPNGAYLTYHYDAAQRLTGVTNSSGERVSYTLDMAGRMVEETLRDRGGATVHRITRRYDPLGNIIELARGDRVVARYSYDAGGNVTAQTDALNNRTVLLYDGFNNLTRQINALQHTTDYSYNRQNKITAAKDARGNKTLFTYDGFGQLRSAVSPDAGTTTYSYDSAGNLIEQIDARGTRVRFSYDALNRLTRKSFPTSPADTIVYSYDDRTSGNHGVGRLTATRDGTGSAAYRYDEFGNIIQEQRVIDDIRYTWRYEHDEIGALTKLVYPSGRIVNYQRDMQGRIAAITTRQREGIAQQSIAQDLVYDPSGEILAMTFGNGLVTRRQFDLEHRLTTIQTLSSLMHVRSLRYEYDATGNVLAAIDTIAPRRSQFFAYDNLHHLVSARGDYGDVTYRYDAVGNRVQRLRDNGRAVSLDNYIYSTHNNRLLRVERGDGDVIASRAFSHDEAGNTLVDLRGAMDKLVFAYDDNNRLVNAQRGKHLASYWHNALGQRAIKITDGQAQHFHYDFAGNLLAETDADGHPVREYIYAQNQRIAMITIPTDRKAARLPADLIVDSEQDRTFKSGAWQLENKAAGFLGANYLVQSVARAAPAPDPASNQRMVWPVSVLESGEYAVHVVWTSHPDRTPRARYSITHAAGTTHIDLDQRHEGGAWQMLGRFSFRRGQRYEVSVTALAPGNLVADAIKVAWADVQLPAPATPTAYYFHNDLLGTPEMLSDETQSVVWSADIAPFGETVETATQLRQPLRLQGQYQDPETGLHYNYFREYDPSLGRYIESDPAGLQGGANSYAYVLPNPLRGVDPMGLSPHLLDETRNTINPHWLHGTCRSLQECRREIGINREFSTCFPNFTYCSTQIRGENAVLLPQTLNPATLTPRR